MTYNGKKIVLVPLSPKEVLIGQENIYIYKKKREKSSRKSKRKRKREFKNDGLIKEKESLREKEGLKEKQENSS